MILATFQMGRENKEPLFKSITCLNGWIGWGACFQLQMVVNTLICRNVLASCKLKVTFILELATAVLNCHRYTKLFKRTSGPSSNHFFLIWNNLWSISYLFLHISRFPILQKKFLGSSGSILDPLLPTYA
jgi:hypothetical protein